MINPDEIYDGYYEDQDMSEASEQDLIDLDSLFGDVILSDKDLADYYDGTYGSIDS